jgi:hypothetical protein
VCVCVCVCISTVSYLLFMVVCFFSRLFEKRHFLLIKKFFSFFFVIDFCLSSPFKVFFSLRVYTLSLIFTPLILSNALMNKELCVLCKSG